jgi:Na+-translocating ferredoxin:NAD+ oxidoreductase RnfD subunit
MSHANRNPQGTVAGNDGQHPRPESSQPGSPETPRAGWWPEFLKIDQRFLAPLLITCILLAGQLSFRILESWTQTLLAIVTAIVCEMVLGKWITGRVPHLASAYVTGISVGILIRSPYFWPFALCAALSITTKYVLRWRGRHLWNPSNFGVSAMLFLYPIAVAGLSFQWGNDIAPMIVVWILGSLIIAKVKRFHICITYVISFILLAWVRSLFTDKSFESSVAPLTGPMYQLFVFFMITDPRTTVSGVKWQCLVVFLVAVVEMLLRLADQVYAPFYALFLVGPVALAIELAFKKSKPAPAPVEKKSDETAAPVNV